TGARLESRAARSSSRRNGDGPRFVQPFCAFAVFFGLMIVTALAAAAQQHEHSMSMPGMHMSETKSSAPYHPGLGEMMTAFVQPRHIKLGLAEAEQNWPYAAYELDELAETFVDIGKLVPMHDGMSIPNMIASTVKQPMAALEKAIAAKDRGAFDRAYADLTAACNACHRSAGHPMIVIKIPVESPYPDQDFRPTER